MRHIQTLLCMDEHARGKYLSVLAHEILVSVRFVSFSTNSVVRSFSEDFYNECK
jgi:hypothetical protein